MTPEEWQEMRIHRRCKDCFYGTSTYLYHKSTLYCVAKRRKKLATILRPFCACYKNNMLAQMGTLRKLHEEKEGR